MSEVPGTAHVIPPERAVRLLRAKAAELEAIVHEAGSAIRPMDQMRADVALVYQLLADHIERVEVDP